MSKNSLVSKVLRQAIVVALATGCSFVAQAATWDLATDFNLNSNSGVWTYYAGNDSAKTPMYNTDGYGQSMSVFIAGTQGWFGRDYEYIPLIGKNVSGAPITVTGLYEGALIGTGAVFSQTDYTNVGGYSLFIVWKSPVCDVVNISGSVTMLLDGNDMWKLSYCTTELASGEVSGLGEYSSDSFSVNNFNVHVGDELTLAIGGKVWGANLNTDVLTISTVQSPLQITGTFTFADQADTVGDIGVAVDFMQNGVTVKTKHVFADANGNYTLPYSDIELGTYDVLYRAHGWLHKLVTGVEVDSDGAVVNVSFDRNGDVDGDNEITSTDLSILGLGLGMAGD